MTLPRQRLVRVFRARRFSLFRPVNYAEQKTEATLQKGFFLRLGGRSRNSGNKGDLAEIATSLNHIATSGRLSAFRKKCNRANSRRHFVRVFRNGIAAQSNHYHRSAFRLNDKVPRTKQRTRRSYGGTWFECAAVAVFLSFPGGKLRQVNNRGGGPIAAPDSKVFHAAGQVRRANNRGDTGDVVPGSVSSPSLVLSRRLRQNCAPRRFFRPVRTFSFCVVDFGGNEPW